MRKIFSSIVLLTIINGCSTNEVKPQVVIEPVVEVKKEDPFEIAKQSCLAENAKGCIDFGWIMVEQKDYGLAKTAFGMAYDYGEKDGKSCGMFAWYLEKGKGGSQDYKDARKYYQKAIDLRDTDSLGSLAHLYSKGLGGERSYFKATKLFEKSCNAGTTDVNYENCYNAGYSYSKGEGVRQDNFKAVKLYRKACSGGYADACTNLGWMYDYGKGVRQNKSTAKKYYGKGCDMGHDLGCTNYAKLNR